MRERTGSVSVSVIGCGVMCDAGRWLAARRERRREEEVKALGQGRSDRRRSDIAATSTRAHGSVAARRGVAWCDIPPLSKDGQS
jgi:hypothetical protein